MDQSLTKFKLGASRARTAMVTFFMAALLLLVGVPLLICSVLVVLEVDSTLSSEEKAIVSVLLLCTGALIFFYVWRTLREYPFRRANLTFTGDALIVNDPRGLTAPVQIPLSEIAACAVDKGPARTPSAMFPLTRTSSWSNAYSPGALESDQGYFVEAGAARGSVLPMSAENVNLIIVFRRPFFFDVDTAVPGERHRLKVRAATQALIVPARKPGAVAEYLASRGVRVGLETVDLENWQPPFLEALIGKFERARAVIMGWAPSEYAFLPGQPPMMQLPTVPVQPMPVQPMPAQPMPAVNGFNPVAAPPRPSEFAQSDAQGLSAAEVSKRLRRSVFDYFAAVGLLTLVLLGSGLYLLFAGAGFGAIFIVFALLVVWALIPRGGNESASDGIIEFDNALHPQVHQILHQVAAQISVDPPSRTGVTFELDAGVIDAASEFANRRAYEMRVGLPLLAISDRREFGALAAHELAHVEQVLGHRRFAGRAMERALIAAHVLSEHILSFVMAPLTTRLFRSIFATFREAEYLADARAAQLYGPDAVSSMLKKTVIADALLPTYWNNFAEPALNLGLHPPLVAGFRAFIESQGRTEWLATMYLDELDRNLLLTDEFSTHPAVAKRLANLRASASPLAPPDLSAPHPLLADDGATLEAQLLQRLAPDRVAALRSSDWSTALDLLTRARWDADAARLQTAPGASVADLVDLAKQFDRDAVAAVFANALLRAGATLQIASPGEKPQLTINGISIRPDETVDWLAGPTIDAAQWSAAATANQLQHLPLGDVAAPPAITV